ncbi:MAG: hypothetical protein ACW99A_02800 [Candidatus Kariarchaeaceae archaeon]|jgi:hypothetical protein
MRNLDAVVLMSGILISISSLMEFLDTGRFFPLINLLLGLVMILMVIKYTREGR